MLSKNKTAQKTMKKTGFILALSLIVLSIFAEEPNYPKTVINGKEYYIYTVQKSEGFYAISKKFNVTIKQINDANQIGEGLKLGQTLYIPVNPTEISVSTYTPVSKNTPSYTVHVVEKGETLYSLSKRYGVTVDDIKNNNPESDVLSIGEELRIPKTSGTILASEHASEQVQPAPQSAPAQPAEPAVEPIVESATVEDFFESAEEDWAPKNKKNSVNMAILMPFNINNYTENDEKFVDFYRGCIIAADSLTKLGYNVTFDTYDIGKTKESIKSVLSDNRLSNVDLIIGPAYSAQIPFVSDFAKAHNIKVIVPFANNVPQIESNANIFQIVCQQQSLYPNVAKKCAEEWKNHKVLIVKPDSAGIRYNKKDFVDILIPQLEKENIWHQYISEINLAHEINVMTASDSSNFVVVVPTTNEVKLTQISDRFDALRSNRVAIFGFPEWNDLLHKDLYTKPLYMFSNYLLNFKSPEVQKFYNTYFKKFGVPPMQNNPSYSIFGFDITLFFGNAWCNENNEDSEMLQMNFEFEKVGNGGYANHGVYLQLLNP